MERDPYKSLLIYSFRLLARKAYSQAEMKRKLSMRAKKVLLPEAGLAIEKVMDRLEGLGYIDDKKIVSNVLEYRLHERPVGKFGFLIEMKRKGINTDRAKEEWEKRGIDEHELARALFENKKRFLAKLPLQKQKEKFSRLLASRGFSSDIVWGLLEKLK